MKRLLTEAPVLAFYDAKKTVIKECDSSSVGLGAVITQEGRPIAFASHALTATERNYAQIEKECLAIVFATEHFDQYIIGKEKVKVLSDHKPLMTIFKKPILTCPKRLQRMRLRLQHRMTRKKLLIVMFSDLKKILVRKSSKLILKMIYL